MFQGERKVAVDEALAKMEERHAQENDELRALNEKELKELEKQKLSPEELQQKRAQLLNQQQLRQSSLDKKHADERKQIQNGVVSDWEIRFARAKLELKEKHYQVRAHCRSPSVVFYVLNRPFYRYGGHLEFYCSRKDIIDWQMQNFQMKLFFFLFPLSQTNHSLKIILATAQIVYWLALTMVMSK